MNDTEFSDMVCDFMLNARQCHSSQVHGVLKCPHATSIFLLQKEKQKEKQPKKKIWIIYTPLYIKSFYFFPSIFNL
jgi:hypothetical protein